MKIHDWKKTSWSDEKGNTTTIHDVLFRLKSEPAVEIELADLSHIPSTYIEEHRKLTADLSVPIIVQENRGGYHCILDGHHRRQKAIDEKRTHLLAKVFKGDVINEMD